MNDILAAAVLEAIPIGCVVIDPSGRMLRANSVAAGRLRRAPQGLVGENFFDAFGLPDGKAAFLARRPGADSPSPLSLDLDLADTVVRVRGFTHGGERYGVVVFEPAHTDARMRRVAEAWEAALATVREVRHEINNPLMGILGQIELLQARGDLTPPVAQKLAAIERESGRIRAMTAKLGNIKRV